MPETAKGKRTIMDEKLKEAMSGILEKLTDEQIEQAKTCKTMDEFMVLAGEWGIELPDELMDAVAGGESSEIPSVAELARSQMERSRAEGKLPRLLSMEELIQTLMKRSGR